VNIINMVPPSIPVWNRRGTSGVRQEGVGEKRRMGVGVVMSVDYLAISAVASQLARAGRHEGDVFPKKAIIAE
jgi:hypothetical protein